jgi:chromosome segregation ATPase
MTRSLLALAFALALLAGCGGGDDDEGGNEGGGGGVTREEFVAEANRICREGEEKLSDITQDAQQKIQQAESQAEQQEVVADVLDQTVEEYRPVLEDLQAVEAPEELSEDWTRFLDGIQQAFDKFPELADATREGDREKLESLTSDFTRIATDTRPFAERNDLQDCLPDQQS